MMKNVRNFCLIMATLNFLISCANQRNEPIDSVETCEALNFIVDSLIAPPHSNRIIISPEFYEGLDSSFFENIILPESEMNDQNIEYFKSQYFVYQSPELDVCFKEKLWRISHDGPRNDTFVYEFSPPLFALDKESFFIYIRGYYSKNDSIYFSDIGYYIEKVNNNWKSHTLYQITH